MTEENYYKARDMLDDIASIDLWLNDSKKKPFFTTNHLNIAFRNFLEKQKELLEEDFSKL